MKTLDLPFPSLVEGSFASITAFTDEELFQKCGVRIAFTERSGGVSEGSYSSLNFGSHVEDDLEKVIRNRSLLLEAFEAKDCSLIVPKQVHGDRILTVEEKAQVEGVISEAAEGADAITVLVNQVAALLCFADCVPVIAVAPGGMFSVVHAGWRGVENRITQKAVTRLATCVSAATGLTKEEILSGINVYIGPYIHSECFETGQEVKERFVQNFGSECMYDENHVDLGAALRIQLKEAGVDVKRIADVNLCTVCTTDKFFSYRAQDGVAGRHGAFTVRL